MAYAFCLRLDPETEALVAGSWRRLVDLGAAGNEMLQLNYVPHLSLAVLDDEPALAVVEAAFDAVCDGPALDIRLGGAGRFTGTDIVWLAVDGGAALSELHQRLLAELPVEKVRDHYRAWQWTPHVTLQMSGNAAATLTQMAAEWPHARQVRLVGLDLVQFSPLTVLRSRALT